MWSIFGYLLSGLLVWGGIGAAIDHWVMHRNHWFMLVGFLLGMGASLYLVWLRFVKE
jgi:ATP synthase protein I